MESLGHRCKPLGPASSVSSVLVSRTKNRERKKEFCIKNRFASPGRGVAVTVVSVRTWSKERELAIVAVDLKCLFSPLLFPGLMNFTHGFGFASEFFPCAT